MAKRKTNRKNNTKEEVYRSPFWPMAGAILMFLLAVFVLLGGFNTGGPLPVNLFKGVYWALGWASYLVPIALVYFGVAKFTTEDHQIPLPSFVSMLAFLVMTASWFQVGFGSYQEGTQTWLGTQGGEIGQLFGALALGALERFPAATMFFVFTMLLFFLTFGISPRVLLKLFKLFGKREEDTDLEALKAAGSNFKMNEGVPVEHSQETEAKPKAGKTEDHEALMTASDPDWKLPGLDLLNDQQDKADAGDVEANAQVIKDTLANFNISVDMEGANIGPRVTQYTLRPPNGVKLTKITALDDNLALDLAAPSIRIEAPIPGKRAVGIEVPNKKSATVRLRSILESSEWKSLKSPLGFSIGKDISGNPIVGDLERMPHLLVAGQTGSGKSVMINDILTSLLYRNSPSDLKLILVDPKQVELKPYDDIPHLLTPVITEPEKCISALKWTVAEMERRYKALSEAHKRNIVEYNKLNKEESMPYIVIIIDELADLMQVASRDVEGLIVRIAQKARAVGIHLVLATQSPRVQVITGLIKANIPAKIGFTVAQEVDSRVIFDSSGAEKLLNRGDMLLTTPEHPKPRRIQAALIEDEETMKVTDFVRMQRPPQYNDEIITQPVQLNGRGGIVPDYSNVDDADEPIYREAVKVVIDSRKASTSLLQRRLRIGYGKAARLIETMEEQGVISHADGNRPREVLVSSVDEVFGGSAAQTSDDVYDDIPDDDQA